MFPLQNKNWPATAVLRGGLTIVFILWLATVMSRYDDNPIEKQQKINVKQAPSNIVIEQLILPPVPVPKAKPQASAVSELANQPPESAIKQVKQSPPVNKQQVEQVYKQLSDQGIDIQIAWPQQVHQQQGASDFMYQCAGMQFAMLNGNKITKVNQFALSDYSDWIRVAQGNLSKKEQHWITAYSLAGTPIRLFPRNIDLRLAQHLANALKGALLVNLRANYQVSNQRLYLTKIQLNNQAIKTSWELYIGECI
ncbi:hypothetical protein [Paraglaciecola psychrophila]|uniref:Uncharacterized protein n=1 Tax=Paraglaciecola psychrophila 170 TaxID=1129794 RepID=K7ACE2_9ALTE|nr:hypothetical protein [Paraglaciecola psychrophila]AGH46460.1 hypothetical protein C427_4358 [Paraglaciecola psychrophila 170]GAC38308.1 hypothetical protein GPSY_2696 [Paraglaciecola psychrophila 170]